MALLRVESLSIQYRARRQTFYAVSDVSFILNDGDTLGLIGESGCGKSTLAMGILGLLPPEARITQGSVRLENDNLLRIDHEARRKLRWRKIAYVPQGAMNSLNPIARVLPQFRETWLAHGGRPRDAIDAQAEMLLRAVGLDARWLSSYPHELSGGMRQRVIIAMALLFKPKLLIADEATTGLDVIVQREVLNVLRSLQLQQHMSLLFVSHDIAVVAELCENIAVMYAGEIVEIGGTENILSAPLHPYTMGLRQAFPDIRRPRNELTSIPGVPPPLTEPIAGCSFAARCPFARARCVSAKPKLRLVSDQQQAACHFAGERELLAARDRRMWAEEAG